MAGGRPAVMIGVVAMLARSATAVRAALLQLQEDPRAFAGGALVSTTGAVAGFARNSRSAEIFPTVGK